jgi:hypothetical protein
MRIFTAILSTSGLILIVGCASTPRTTWRTDYTKNKSNICEVHTREMREVRVPIYYGTPDFWNEKWKAEQEAIVASFPHAHEWLAGGCVRWFDSPKKATLFVCSACQNAEKKWKDTHK